MPNSKTTANLMYEWAWYVVSRGATIPFDELKTGFINADSSSSSNTVHNPLWGINVQGVCICVLRRISADLKEEHVKNKINSGMLGPHD
jgi:hypothetical protein